MERVPGQAGWVVSGWMEKEAKDPWRYFPHGASEDLFIHSRWSKFASFETCEGGVEVTRGKIRTLSRTLTEGLQKTLRETTAEVRRANFFDVREAVREAVQISIVINLFSHPGLFTKNTNLDQTGKNSLTFQLSIPEYAELSSLQIYNPGGRSRCQLGSSLLPTNHVYSLFYSKEEECKYISLESLETLICFYILQFTGQSSCNTSPYFTLFKNCVSCLSKTSQSLGMKPWFAFIKMFVNGYVVSALANGGNTECVWVSAHIPLVNRVLFDSPTEGQSSPGTVILTNNPSGSKFAMQKRTKQPI